jgi:transposase-like protein
MRKLLKKQGFVPKIVVTDKLRSYACAFQCLRLTCRHEQGLRKNNRRNSNRPHPNPASGSMEWQTMVGVAAVKADLPLSGRDAYDGPIASEQ